MTNNAHKALHGKPKIEQHESGVNSVASEGRISSSAPLNNFLIRITKNPNIF
jgi:hypothetical protein